jgi:chemotaxis protein histidine kinase CheA
MYNVLQALDQLSGKISIHSNPEGGTLVEMKFPLGKGEGLPVRTHEEILIYEQED